MVIINVLLKGITLKLPSFEYRRWYQEDINTLDELNQKVLSSQIEGDIYYRGMADYNFICISTFYRHYLLSNPSLKWVDTDVGFKTKISLPEINENEYRKFSLDILDDFYKNLLALGSKKLSYNTIAYLAQHYGLPTNLIDFSIDPKIALFFACSELPDTDCTLYKYDIYAHVKNMISFFSNGHSQYFMTHEDGSPMSNKEAAESVKKALTVIKPDSTSATPIIKLSEIAYGQRIINQKGAFVYHNNICPFDQIMYTVSSETHFHGRKIYKISSKLKPEILSMLEQEGINKEFLYPNESNDENLSIILSAVAKTKKRFCI
jgi:hypothetical protein